MLELKSMTVRERLGGIYVYDSHYLLKKLLVLCSVQYKVPPRSLFILLEKKVLTAVNNLELIKQCWMWFCVLYARQPLPTM